MNSAFDVSAPNFERFRSIPKAAAEAIRSAVYEASGISAPARVVDVGAGTGRIGRAFVEAGDHYMGLDCSLAMLQEFRSTSPHSVLLQGDGGHLPFIDGSFDIVLMMQVLSGADDWMGLLKEARRVLRREGSVAVGHTVNEKSGIDAQMKRRLKNILAELHSPVHDSNASRQDAMTWLASSATRHSHRTAHCWSVTTSAREFIERRRTGSRFTVLPVDVQETALDRLRDWAEVTFGLDAPVTETREFELHVYTF